ncbi:MAG: hypothetical protein HYZ14_12605 [Bacteroidetes bacterium]|nr:hypothetical protein [Bacteroidota bacterium]
MKKYILLLAVCLSLLSCKMVMKGAARYWTKKQIKEFVSDCETHSAKLLGEEKAHVFCDCAVDEVSEKYTNYDDVKKAGIIEVLKIARNCKDAN